MKRIELISLEIKNFQGIKDLHIGFDGCHAKIRGDNGTGKTTVKSAFNWLLFGKNSEGKTDFGIKPTDENGDVIHRLETSVEAVFDVDGKPKQFKKTLKENWVRKRGAVTESYTGNENNFFVNTVPKKKTEYMVEINSLINEDLFKMITDPLYFNQINWKDRREMMLDICGDISDEDVFSMDSELLPLKAELNGRTIDEYKSVLTRNMKSANKELSIIPSQITEAELAKPSSTGEVDVSKKQALEKAIADLSTEKIEILNGEEIVKLKTERGRIERDIFATQKGLAESDTKAYAEMQELIKLSREKGTEIVHLHNKIDTCNSRLNGIETDKKRLTKQWDEEFHKQFHGSVCPVCGQELPPDVLEEKKKAFNTERADTLDRLEISLENLKKSETDLLIQKSNLEAECDRAEQTYYDIEKQIKYKKSECDKEIEDYKVDCDKLRETYKKQIAEIDAKIADYDSISKEKINAIDEQISDLRNKLHEINVVEAGIELEKRQNARIEELKERQKELSKSYMNDERLLCLAEKFVITKVSMLNEKINKHFKYANFKLFTQNINGGIEETCEVTYNGIPFKDLNTAGRINIGLDIINTLCEKYGTIAPIFIDSAESVTRFIDTNSQKILLVVDENHKELYVEREDNE